MSTFAQKFIFQAFKNIQGGRLVISLPDGSIHHFGQVSDNIDPPIHVQIFNTQAFQWVVSRGDIGVAESYFKKLWHTEDLERLLRLALLARLS